MENTQEVAVINPVALQEIMSSLPETLAANRNSVVNCADAWTKLKYRADVKMTDDLDTEVLEFIKRAKVTGNTMNAARSPMTKIMDLIKSEFTGDESKIKGIISDAEGVRNTYANHKIAEQRKQEAEAQKLRDIEAEKGAIAADVELQIRKKYTTVLANTKLSLNAKFESSSLQEIEEMEKYIRDYPGNLREAEIRNWDVSIMPVYMSTDDLQAVKIGICDKLHEVMTGHFFAEIQAYKRDLLDKVPSKKRELEELKNADQKKREEMEEAANIRKQEADEAAAKEKRDADEKAKKQSESISQASAINADFNAQSAVTPTVAKGKEVHTITVQHAQGYAEMFAVWFPREGGKLPMDKLGKFTLDRIKGYFESLADNTGEKIESKFLKYTSSYVTSSR